MFEWIRVTKTASRPAIAVIVIASWTASAPARTASATTFEVPGDFATIQAALDSPLVVAGDEVVLVSLVYTGPGNRDLDMHGKAITLRSASGDPDRCRIDCEGLGRAFVFQSGETNESKIEGIEIANGVSGVGGGMFAAGDSNPLIERCTFSFNRSLSHGGGFAVNLSAPTIVNCAFNANSAAYAGGGVSISQGSPTIIGCEFRANTVIDVAYGTGGGLSCANGEPIIVGCVFSRNIASGNGGGAHAVDSAPTISHCLFLLNDAGSGGGIFNSISNTTIQNCVFNGNSAGGEGGAIANVNGSSPIVVDCTIHANAAILGGGMASADGTEPVVANSIFWANGGGEIDGGGITTVIYSIVKDGFPGDTNMDVDPGFTDPAGGDGFPGSDDDDLHIGGASPAIDAGDNAAVPAGVTTDIDGNPRFVDDPATADSGSGKAPVVDIGAYEYAPYECSADLDGNGIVGFDDVLQVLAEWGPCLNCPEDLTGDGVVGFDDLLWVLATWGPCV